MIGVEDESSDDEQENAVNGKDDKHFIDFSRKLVCVQYPGVVENHENALKTLGGLPSIENAVASQNTRLELRFRPNDHYAKPVVSDKEFDSTVLVKIKIRRPIWDPNVPSCSKDPGPDPNASISSSFEVVGVNVVTFKFNRLCDYQMLPLATNEPETSTTPLEYIYKQIVPDELPSFDNFHDESSMDMPLFFPPCLISRYNNPHNRFLYDKTRPSKRKVLQKRAKPVVAPQVSEKNVIRKSRKARPKVAIFFSFEEKDVPTEPSPSAVQAFNTRGLPVKPFEQLKKLFEERPIWSKSALLHKTDLLTDQIKVALPNVAYYFFNGPWRVMWVKFGYDPRKDPSSRIYQTFDYRVRASALKIKVQAKRSAHAKMESQTVKKKISLKDIREVPTVKKPVSDERSYILRPGMTPSGRQMFYQFCDLYIPEIQNMLSRLPDVTPGTVCTYKNGWLPSGFSDQCREIVSQYVTMQVKKEISEDNQEMQQTKMAVVNEVEEEPIETYDIDDDDMDEAQEIDEKIKHYYDIPGTSSQGLHKDEPEHQDDEAEFQDDGQSSDETDESDEYRQFSDESQVNSETVEEINNLLSILNVDQTCPKKKKSLEIKQEKVDSVDEEELNHLRKLIDERMLKSARATRKGKAQAKTKL